MATPSTAEQPLLTASLRCVLCLLRYTDPAYVPLYGMIETTILKGEETKDDNGSYIVSATMFCESSVVHIF